MSERELRDHVGVIAKAVENHEKILSGDKITGYPGLKKLLEENAEGDVKFRKETLECLNRLDNSIKESNRTLLKEIAEVAVWKAGIQETPKRIAKKVMFFAAFLAALMGIGSFFWRAWDTFFKRLFE